MEEKHVFQDAVSCAASETFGTFLVPIFDFFKSLFSLQNLFKFICSVLVLVILTLIFKLARKRKACGTSCFFAAENGEIYFLGDCPYVRAESVWGKA